MSGKDDFSKKVVTGADGLAPLPQYPDLGEQTISSSSNDLSLKLEIWKNLPTCNNARCLPFKDSHFGPDRLCDICSLSVKRIENLILRNENYGYARGRKSEHDKVYALYNEVFMPIGEFTRFTARHDIMNFFERFKELENDNG